LNRLCGLKNVFRMQSDPVIFRQIHPSHRPRRIDEEFRRPRYAAAVLSLAFVNEVISTYGVQLRVGQEGICESGPLAQLSRDIGLVDADRDRANARIAEFAKLLLNAPQLGDAGRSPVAAIENE
jgi:hypothetical protein